MRSKDTQKVRIQSSPLSGKVLFAADFIKKGETVISWKPKVLTRQQAKRLSEDEYKHYTYPDGDHMLWMQPPERFMNHSCDPNTHVVGRSDVALRDIAPGEEVTSDYMDLEVPGSACNCGSAKCRGVRA